MQLNQSLVWSTTAWTTVEQQGRSSWNELKVDEPAALRTSFSLAEWDFLVLQQHASPGIVF